MLGAVVRRVSYMEIWTMRETYGGNYKHENGWRCCYIMFAVRFPGVLASHADDDELSWIGLQPKFVFISFTQMNLRRSLEPAEQMVYGMQFCFKLYFASSASSPSEFIQLVLIMRNDNAIRSTRNCICFDVRLWPQVRRKSCPPIAWDGMGLRCNWFMHLTSLLENIISAINVRSVHYYWFYE